MNLGDKICAIDIGTYRIRGLVADVNQEQNNWRVSGLAETASAGVRRGEIVDLEEAQKNLNQLINQLEINSGYKIGEAWVNIGGLHVYCKEGRGAIAVSRANGEISPEDINRAIEAAMIMSSPRNRQNIHIIPRYYKIDDRDIVKNPVGMQGNKLEANVLIVEAFTPQFKHLQRCLEDNKLNVNGFIYTPLAVSESVLTQRQKELGVMALDFGGGTTNLTIFEEQDILDISTLPIGSNHLTNDLAVGLRIPVDIAEELKKEFGRVDLKNIDRRRTIDLSKFGGDGSVPQYEIAKIIQARIEEILDLVNKELKRVSRQHLLPGGVVICGGGAQLKGLVDLVKEYLELPVQIGNPYSEPDMSFKEISSPEWATACGIVDWVLKNKHKGITKWNANMSNIARGVTGFFKRMIP
ncbi:MAG TPA: cell division protein FtsA [Candidatus Portnoybacteria bacterium]|nr:cell division protein FtsA [Candidatus Portnoybacteria bacterium]